MRDLLEEWAPRVYRFARRLTLDPHAAEDLTQETLLRAWNHRKELRHVGRIGGWLFRIASNLWKDQLRRNCSRVAQASTLLHDPQGDAPPPEREAVDREELRRALSVLDALPARQREVLHLSACESMSTREIGEILEISTDAVKASLSLARKALRERLLNEPQSASDGRHESKSVRATE